MRRLIMENLESRLLLVSGLLSPNSIRNEL